MRVSPPSPKRNAQQRVLTGLAALLAFVIALLVLLGVRPLDAAVWVLGWLVVASAIAAGLVAGLWAYARLFGSRRGDRS